MPRDLDSSSSQGRARSAPPRRIADAPSQSREGRSSSRRGAAHDANPRDGSLPSRSQVVLRCSPLIQAYNKLPRAADDAPADGFNCSDAPPETLFIRSITPPAGVGKAVVPAREPPRHDGSPPTRGAATGRSTPQQWLDHIRSLLGRPPSPAETRTSAVISHSSESFLFLTARSGSMFGSLPPSPGKSRAGELTEASSRGAVREDSASAMLPRLCRALEAARDCTAAAADGARGSDSGDALVPHPTGMLGRADDDDDWDLMIDGDTAASGKSAGITLALAPSTSEPSPEPQWTMAPASAYRPSSISAIVPVHDMTGEPQWAFVDHATPPPVAATHLSNELDTASECVGSHSQRPFAGSPAKFYTPPSRRQALSGSDQRPQLQDMQLQTGYTPSLHIHDTETLGSAAGLTVPSSATTSTPSNGNSRDTISAQLAAAANEYAELAHRRATQDWDTGRDGACGCTSAPFADELAEEDEGEGDRELSVPNVQKAPQFVQSDGSLRRPLSVHNGGVRLRRRPSAKRPGIARSLLSPLSSGKAWRGGSKVVVAVPSPSQVPVRRVDPPGGESQPDDLAEPPTSTVQPLAVVEAGQAIERWQEVPDQVGKAQKQIKLYMNRLGSMSGDPLGCTRFHPPLFAATWGVVSEACLVPGVMPRAYKELVAASVSRGNGCRFCWFWHVNAACSLGLDIMKSWKEQSLTPSNELTKRQKAVALWFRDAHCKDFCRQAGPAPFTVKEATELLAVAFVNNVMNRTTIAHLTRNETLPMMGPMRPLFQYIPSTQKYMYKIMKPASSSPAPQGLSADLRPHSKYLISYSLRWALRSNNIARALAYWEHIVNHHLKGRFLPASLCDAVVEFLEKKWTGQTTVTDRMGQWALRAAKQGTRDQPHLHQLAMQYMLVVAVSPADVQASWKRELHLTGWHKRQVKAMAPFAAFHAARVNSDWQASTQCITEEEANDEALWDGLDESW